LPAAIVAPKEEHLGDGFYMLDMDWMPFLLPKKTGLKHEKNFSS